MALVAAVLPASARGAYFGYNDNSTLSGQFTAEQDSLLLSRAAADSVRIDVDWSWVEGTRGSLDLGMYDAIYSQMLRRGIRPLLSVMGAPQWAWPPLALCLPSATCHFPPDRSKNADWSRFVGEVARRFPRAAAIEIWNEPNLSWFWAPRPDPVRYTELLRLGYAAVKRVDPAMPVLGGALAPVMSQDKGRDWGLRPFLEAMYAGGAAGSMDGLAVHALPPKGREGSVYGVLGEAAETRDAAGDRSPLWLTELAASSTGGYTEASQAALLGDLVPRLLRRRGLRGVYVHTLADPRPFGFDAENGFGILRYGASPKPAWCAIVQALRGSPPCLRPPVDRIATAHFNAQELLQVATEAALAHRRATGSYAGLSTARLHALAPALSATAPDLQAEPGAAADPSRVAVLPAPGHPDGVRLCNTSRAVRSHCVTMVAGASWRYTTQRGSIAAVVAATDAGRARPW